MKYNIHCFLWDLFRIKSKLLCKLGFHNYQFKILRTREKPKVETCGNTITYRYYYDEDVVCECNCCKHKQKRGG